MIRRSCIDTIADGTVYLVDKYLPKLLEWAFFKPFIWLLSYLYNQAQDKIWPTPGTAQSSAQTYCYGKFICPSCGRRWSSVRSLPNVNQPCKFCSTYARPYEQRTLQPSDNRLIVNLTYTENKILLVQEDSSYLKRNFISK